MSSEITEAQRERYGKLLYVEFNEQYCEEWGADPSSYVPWERIRDYRRDENIKAATLVAEAARKDLIAEIKTKVMHPQYIDISSGEEDNGTTVELMDFLRSFIPADPDTSDGGE